MAGTRPKLRDLFNQAVECQTPEEEGAYLEQACQGDAALRARLEELLRAHRQAGSFLQDPSTTGTATVEEPSPTELTGARIGPYQLLEPIGEGGMGTVWVAQQTAPVKRHVAVKLIKAGMDSKQVVARFEQERQALALMDHPNIAKIHDAGATPDGRPFFVMELVKGVPITRYCDEHRLTPRQRLELFVPVCQAVQHAHQKGIIHRDLKPSNVLVATYDGSAVPKVIDFGVAKAAGQQLTDLTLNTGLGAVVGTLEYLSPEQAGLSQLDVDTRSDVYSLGVLLYELLAGSPPFSRKELERVGLLEMLRLIREQEPPRPSTRLSTADALPSLAATRGTEPKRLAPLVRGELDWIVMRALEKDRSRRYETADALAQDVERHLRDEPVLAGPPGRAYRLRKFLRRNRGPALAVSFVGLALVGGVVGTTWGMIQATTEGAAKDQANTLLRQEKESLSREKRQAQVNLSTLLLDKGLEACERGEVGLGLLLLVRSLDAAPPDAHELQRVIRINLVAWSHRTSHLRGIFPHEGTDPRAFFSPDGTTVLTQAGGKVRVWDTATGQLRGEFSGGHLWLWPILPGSGRAAFSPDGKRVLTIKAPHAQFRDTATVEPTGQPLPLNACEGGVAFSADSKVVLTVANNALRRWDVATGQPLGEPVRFAEVSFSRDGKTVGTVSPDGKTARFWDTATGQPVGQPLTFSGGGSNLMFSPDGKRVLTHGGGSAQLWDPATGQPIGQPLPRPEGSLAPAFSADGKTVAVGGPSWQLWDAATGTPLGAPPPKGDSPVIYLDSLFALYPRYLYGRPSYAQRMDRYRVTPEVPVKAPEFKILALTPGGPIVRVRSEDGLGQLWNADTGDPVGAPLPRPHADLSPVFSPDYRMYATLAPRSVDAGVRWDGIPRLWKLGEGKPHGQPLRPSLNKLVAYSPDARFLLVASSGGRPPAIGPDAWLDLCDATGGSLGRVAGGDNDVIASLAAAFSPDGRLVLAAVHGKEWSLQGSRLEETHLWAAEGGKLTSRWKGVGLTLAFSPDGKRFAEGGAPADGKRYTDADRRAVRLWDAATLKRVAPPLEHPAAVHAVAFSPDGNTLLTGCGNNPTSPVPQGGEARLWDVATGQPARGPGDGSILRLPHQGAVVAVAFSPDGKTVLTGSTDHAARLWDAATGKPLPVPPLSHKDTVTSVAFSHDGRTVLTASRDGTSRLWDVATGKPLGPPLPHRNWDINHTFVAFSPDDQAVLTAGKDGELTRWQVETAPVQGDVPRIRFWVQVLTGMELDQEGVVGGLSPETWNEYRRQLEERGGPPLP